VKIDPTTTFTVSAGGDDGYWISGLHLQYNSTLSYLGFGNAGASLEVNSFTRFTNITIPQGATISSAKIQIVAASSIASTAVNTTISALDADNASAPTTISEADSATRTTASVDWNSVPAFIAGTTYDSPDISSVIQEVVNRPGWNSGNS